MSGSRFDIRSGLTAGLVIVVITTATSLRNGLGAAIEVAAAGLVAVLLVLFLATRAQR